MYDPAPDQLVWSSVHEIYMMRAQTKHRSKLTSRQHALINALAETEMDALVDAYVYGGR